MEQNKEGSKNMNVAIHSQVMKIKQESEEEMKQPEMRRVVRGVARQRPRSPLGLAEREITTGCSSVGSFRNNYLV